MSETIRGVLVQGHNVQVLRACGSTALEDPRAQSTAQTQAQIVYAEVLGPRPVNQYCTFNLGLEQSCLVGRVNSLLGTKGDLPN